MAVAELCEFQVGILAGAVLCNFRPRLQNREVGFSWQVQYFVTFVLFLRGRATSSEL